MRTHSYPAWFYGPGGASKVFTSEAEVPAGWHDHPSKHITPEKTGSKPLEPVVDRQPAAKTGAAPVVAKNDATALQTGGTSVAGTTTDVSNTLDADGHPWSAEMHSATKNITKGGLWRMKVGVTRPDPMPGYPKPALDL